MRFTLFQILSALLIVALILALFVNQRRSQLQIATLNAKEESRERMEDEFELALVKRLAPGDNLDADPYYRLLVDRVITSSDPTFDGYTKFIAMNVKDTPSSFDGCELHEFEALVKDGSSLLTYTVVVRDNRCLLVFLAVASLRPV